MKKVLSVLLAAAMVAGMSVASFADNTKVESWETWEAAAKSCVTPVVAVEEMSFDDEMIVVHTDGSIERVEANTDYKNMKVGDDLYFPIMLNGEKYTGEIDQHWSLNIKAKYVKKAAFWTAPVDGTATPWGAVCQNAYKFVKVEIVDELDDLDAQNVKFQMYIADNKHGTNQSAGAKLNYSFDNYLEKFVSFDFTNDVDYMAKWIVAKEAKGTAIFDFEDVAYFTVKMIPEEEVIFNFESKDYVKAIEKIFDYEGDYTTYNFKGSKDEFSKVGELFIEADEDTFIYGWDGEALVEIEAEYVEDYDIDGVNVGDGWVIETKELGYYVVSAIEAEIEVEAEVEAPVEADKANPETGAADFVGAAVAMAVVSVAAAGALALKK